MTAEIAAKTAALSEVVASNVRAEAARRGWTQRELAQRLGMSHVTVSDRYRGRSPWTVDELEGLGRAMGIDYFDLLVRPKGFEPLTFWLGADHTMTYWWDDLEVVGSLFCDSCGMKPATGFCFADDAEVLADVHAVWMHNSDRVRAA